MLINNKNIGFATEEKVLGAIVAVNLLDGTVTLMDDNEEIYTVDMEQVIELEELGTIGNQYIYEGDVVKVTETGKVYEIIKQEDNEIAMHLLDNKLNRTEGGLGLSFERQQLSVFGGVVELLGNIHEIKAKQPTVDFNLAVFRYVEDGEVAYYYAGNNKENEQVDLIKVIFLGHQLLEEEDYERETVTYADFLELVADGTLTKVNPMELANYVTGLLLEKKNPNVGIGAFVEFDEVGVASEDEQEVDEREKYPEEYCENCDEHYEDCECDLW